MEQIEVNKTAHESAHQVALEAARRMDIKDPPGKIYKETYEKVYDFLVSKHKAN